MVVRRRSAVATRTSIVLAVAMFGVAACSAPPANVTTGTAASTRSLTPERQTPVPPTTESPVPSTHGPLAAMQWQECHDEAATNDALECTTLRVPLDDAAPDGETVVLALVRLPAAGRRQGAVLFNPGGPGGSGFEFVAQAGQALQAVLGATGFDFIGFDPRGVERSGGIRCQTDAELDRYAYLDDTPDDSNEEALLDEASSAFADACTAKYADDLRHYSTANTARDMDSIRAALGDDQLTYVGISYGTHLGAVYASMFPDRVRAMVLDSAFDPGGDSVEQQFTTQLKGFDEAFVSWAKWCQGDTSCAFHAVDVGARWDALLSRLDANPLAADDGRKANQAVMGTATIAAMYQRAAWPVLAAALAAADKGDADGLFNLADEYRGRDDDGSWNTLGAANDVITCASGIGPQTPPDPEALAAQLRALSPRFGGTTRAEDLTDPCIGLMPTQQIAPIEYSGDGPIMVVGGVNDPATPIRWAEELTAALGRNARLVRYTGEGHGQILQSKCVGALAAVLVHRAEFRDKPSCDPDPEIPRPDWWGDLPVPAGVSPVIDRPDVLGALGLTPSQGYGELRSSADEASGVQDAYEQALREAGFAKLGEQEPIPGATQAIYSAPGGDVFAIVVFSRESLAASGADLPHDVPPAGHVLILLLKPAT